MIRIAALIAMAMCSMKVSADPYDGLIDSAARRHGVDPIVLRSVVQQETKKQPWAFNCDGEGFYFNTKDQAVLALWQISRNPWLAKLSTKSNGTLRQFFPSKAQALSFVASYQAAQRRVGQVPVSLKPIGDKDVSSGQASVRQLWVVNTDIGIAQINYRFHGVDRARVQQWFDPAFNLDYAASLIASHKRSGSSDLEAAGSYHSKTPSVREKYLRKLRPIYEREKANAFNSFTSN